MKKTFIILVLLTSTAFASSVFKIEVGKDYSSYSNSELKRRLWKLERAVWQLQEKVFQLQSSSSRPASSDTWLCNLSAAGDNFSATGGSRAVAKAKVIKECTVKQDSSFFCKNDNVKCEQ